MKNNIGLLLTKRAFLQPEREVYVESDGSRRYTYRELNDRANRLANAFLADGIEKGERVGLLLMNSAEFMEAFFALGKIVRWAIDKVDAILVPYHPVVLGPRC